MYHYFFLTLLILTLIILPSNMFGVDIDNKKDKVKSIELKKNNCFVYIDFNDEINVTEPVLVVSDFIITEFVDLNLIYEPLSNLKNDEKL